MAVTVMNQACYAVNNGSRINTMITRHYFLIRKKRGMDTLQSIWAFRYVVELGSFTKAAEMMNISTAMASKHIHHLEQYLQSKLLNRSSRRLSLTPAGEQYYQRCVSALNMLDDASKAAQEGTLKPRGLLRITAPAWCATPYFARLLAQYCRHYPEVQLQLSLDSRHTDLVAEGIDLALRVTSHPEPNLIVKPLTFVDFYWVASPDYVQQHGMPHSVADLSEHFGLLPTYVNISLPMHTVASSNNALMLYQFALNGMGMAYLPEWVIKDDVATGRLVKILPGQTAGGHTLYAAYMNREFLGAKVRSLIDFLADIFHADTPQPITVQP